MAIYLGIDGGGTKTTCVVADENNILGTATSAGSNITRHGDARVREALQAAVRDACAAAKVDPGAVVRACVGLSGAGRPEVREAVTRMMREVLRGQIEVVTDLETTLEAAFGDGPGVITIAGTGSIAYGRDAGGQTARAGGWGLAISDEGSGQWIGRAAVSAVLGAKDASEDPALLKPILELWELTYARRTGAACQCFAAAGFFESGSVGFGRGRKPPPKRSLDGAPYRSGSRRRVLRRAGGELATLARSVIRRLFGTQASVRVAMAGGVFRQSDVVRRVFYNGVIAEFPQATVLAEIVDAVDGALALARKATR